MSEEDNLRDLRQQALRATVLPGEVAATSEGFPDARNVSKRLWDENLDIVESVAFSSYIVDLAQGRLATDRYQVVNGATSAVAYRCLQLLSALRHSAHEASGGMVDEAIRLLEESPRVDCPEEFRVDFMEPLGTMQPHAVLWGIIPHLKLRGYLGSVVADVVGPVEEHPFRAWITDTTLGRCAALLEQVASKEDTLQETYEEIYRNALAKASEMYSMHAGTHGRQQRTLAFIIDYDDTCSLQDTLKDIVKTCISDAVASCPRGKQEEMLQEKQATFKYLVGEYFARQQHVLDTAMPEGLGCSVVKGRSWLDAFLRELTAFDETMRSVICSHKIIQGGKIESVRRAGSQVPLKPYCVKTLREILDRQVHLSIVSVHWSTLFISSSIQAQGIPVNIINDSSEVGRTGEAHFVANEFEFDKDGVCTGEYSRGCTGANGKTQNFTAIRDELRKNGDVDVVFVGDSMTDAGCLLASDLGIILGEDPLLRAVLRVGGVRVKKLHDLLVVLQQGQGLQGLDSSVLYHAGSWAQVYGFIRSLSQGGWSSG